MDKGNTRKVTKRDTMSKVKMADMPVKSKNKKREFVAPVDHYHYMEQADKLLPDEKAWLDVYCDVDHEFYGNASKSMCVVMGIDKPNNTSKSRAKAYKKRLEPFIDYLLKNLDLTESTVLMTVRKGLSATVLKTYKDGRKFESPDFDTRAKYCRLASELLGMLNKGKRDDSVEVNIQNVIGSPTQQPETVEQWLLLQEKLKPAIQQIADDNEKFLNETIGEEEQTDG